MKVLVSSNSSYHIIHIQTYSKLQHIVSLLNNENTNLLITSGNFLYCTAVFNSCMLHLLDLTVLRNELMCRFYTHRVPPLIWALFSSYFCSHSQLSWVCLSSILVGFTAAACKPLEMIGFLYILIFFWRSQLCFVGIVVVCWHGKKGSEREEIEFQSSTKACTMEMHTAYEST